MPFSIYNLDVLSISLQQDFRLHMLALKERVDQKNIVPNTLDLRCSNTKLKEAKVQNTLPTLMYERIMFGN